MKGEDILRHYHDYDEIKIDAWKLEDAKAMATYYLSTKREWWLKPTFWNENSNKEYHEGFCDEDGMAHQITAEALGLVYDLPPFVEDECQ